MHKASKSVTVFIVACLALFGVMSVNSYAQCSYWLSVPFLKQVPPGDWTNTKNCGQTCAVMLGGYFNGSAVNSSAITDQNDWLYNYTSDSRYNDANGWYTGGSKLSAFLHLLTDYHGLSASAHYGSSIDDILDEGCSDNPVIAGVQISGGQLVSSGGVGHWAIVIGYDPYYDEVILNDPGNSNGGSITYSVTDFVNSWASQDKIYIPVSD